MERTQPADRRVQGARTRGLGDPPALASCLSPPPLACPAELGAPGLTPREAESSLYPRRWPLTQVAGPQAGTLLMSDVSGQVD